MNKDLVVYLASPWFSPEQAEREKRVKSKLRELGVNVWSPKENCICSPISDDSLRKKVFSDNCSHIDDADVVFAITDGKDMGTIWEAGYAYARGKKVIYYCETLGAGLFNLMLAQSGHAVITQYDDLNKVPALMDSEEGEYYVGNIE